MTLDPVTLAVIQNGLRQVASEMDLVHEKTSFSPVISEGFDRSNGIYDRATGEVRHWRMPRRAQIHPCSEPARD
jgi:N-methylhydantoinase B